MKKTLFIIFLFANSLSGQNIGINILIPEFNLDTRSTDVITRAQFQLSTPLKENFLRLTSSSSLNTKAVIGRSGSDDLSFGIYTPGLLEQMILSTSGNLSIGTSDTGDRLSIKSPEGDGTNATFRIANPNPLPLFGDDFLLMDADEMDSYSFSGLKLQSRSTSGVEMVKGGGGVGINIDPVPFYKLQVFGDEIDYQFAQQAPAPVLITSPGQGFNAMILDGNDIMTIDEPLVLNGTALNPVVVGGAVPASGYMLSVHGKVMAEEVRVQLNTSWPDYVFAGNYNLMPMDELRDFLEKENHLPGIPSATEIEESGIVMGEMHRMTMEKVEEAILYILQLQEQITQLQIENERLRKAISK